MENQILTTVDLVRENAEKYPNVPCINFYDEVITYRDLDQRTDAVASYLKEIGVQKGDIVSFILGNTPFFFYTFLGIQKIGAIAGPISCWWQAEEVEYLVNHSSPKVLVVESEYTGIISAIQDKISSVKQVIVNSDTPMTHDFAHV